jgi:hypothetical protein
MVFTLTKRADIVPPAHAPRLHRNLTPARPCREIDKIAGGGQAGSQMGGLAGQAEGMLGGLGRKERAA